MTKYRALCAASLIVLLTAGAVLADQRPPDAEILKATIVKGGLVVHLGCGDGKLTASLRASKSFVVHGLDADAASIDKARAHIRQRGLVGKVSVEHWTKKHLPYADNMVRLIVISNPGGVPGKEIERVTAPGGRIVRVQGDGLMDVAIKVRPDTIDQWTHYLHGADGNAVAADDVVGPPRRLQWVAAPRTARSHEHLASISAVVTAGGRIFYIADEGPIASVAMPPDWQLVARDAFSGVLLWKRPIKRWADHLRGFRGGPVDLPRRLVAVGDRVYVTLALGDPVGIFDAATGDALAVCEQTDGAEEILHVGERLVVVTSAAAAKADAAAIRRRGEKSTPRPANIVALRADSGKMIWKRAVPSLTPQTLAARNGKVVFRAATHIVCCDLATGKELWRVGPIEPVKVGGSRPLGPDAWYTPTVVLTDTVVLHADGKVLTAFALDSGKELWTAPTAVTFHAPPDVFVAGGLVWTGGMRGRGDTAYSEGRDPLSGQVKRTLKLGANFTKVGMVHHRCYRNKATNKYVLAGKAGIETVDLSDGKVRLHNWVRGACQYGVIPANGLIYAPPHSCACYITAKINGFNALAAGPDKPGVGETVLEQGEAFGKAKSEKRKAESGRATVRRLGVRSANSTAGSGDATAWATYRGNAARTGRAGAALAVKLQPAWQADIGGKLSAPTIADGKVFVASIDAHSVHALSAAEGKELWRFTAAGRVDSPPTFFDKHVYFGSTDGWVYCLRAADGQLAWRFRGARSDRRIVAYQHLESLWPVHGSVLVSGGEVMFAAGRTSYLDGGIWMYRLDAVTGKKLSETRLYDIDEKTGRQGAVTGVFELTGSMPDVLVKQGESIFMRHVRFDEKLTRVTEPATHLFSPTGLLDDTWWHRTYWVYGPKFRAGWNGWWQVGNYTPSGRILVLDDKRIYGFGRDHYPGSTRLWEKGEKYHLFACPRVPQVVDPEAGKKGRRKIRRMQFTWSKTPEILVRSMVLAGKTLFVAGPVADGKKDADAFRGRNGSKLEVYATTDGAKLAAYDLKGPPVFDGMAAADGRLVIVLAGGRIVCLTVAKTDR